MLKFNPTEEIDVSFNAYVAARQRVHAARMQGGIPDYAFESDYTLNDAYTVATDVSAHSTAML